MTDFVFTLALKPDVYKRQVSLSGGTGSEKLTTVPPSVLRALMLPPCAFTMDMHTERPMPIWLRPPTPFFSGRKPIPSKRCGSLSRTMPVPLSLSLIHI